MHRAVRISRGSIVFAVSVRAHAALVAPWPLSSAAAVQGSAASAGAGGSVAPGGGVAAGDSVVASGVTNVAAASGCGVASGVATNGGAAGSYLDRAATAGGGGGGHARESGVATLLRTGAGGGDVASAGAAAAEDDLLGGLPPLVARATLLVSRVLTAAGLPHAIAGGVAVYLRGHARTTSDVDVLVNAGDLEAVRDALEAAGVVPRYTGAKRRFRSEEGPAGVPVDLMLSGEFPGDGRPKPVAFPTLRAAELHRRRGASFERLGQLRVLDLVTLVEVKLASGESAPHRGRDLTDVQALIEAARLPREFAAELDVSVRPAYVRLWDIVEAKRRAGLE